MKNKKKILMTTSSFPRWKNDNSGIFILETAKNIIKIWK